MASEKGAFRVIGISCRTKNADEMKPGGGRIAALWARFMSEGLWARIPGRRDPSRTLALYTDYESDENGEYTFVLGAEVDSVAKPPEGMVALEVPAARYELFATRKGPIPDVIVETWQRIWRQPRAELPRRFGTDFEVYDARAADPSSAVVDIFIGVAR